MNSATIYCYLTNYFRILNNYLNVLITRNHYSHLSFLEWKIKKKTCSRRGFIGESTKIILGYFFKRWKYGFESILYSSRFVFDFESILFSLCQTGYLGLYINVNQDKEWGFVSKPGIVDRLLFNNIRRALSTLDYFYVCSSRYG